MRFVVSRKIPNQTLTAKDGSLQTVNMEDRGSTVPRRQLGRHLRQLREAAGITVKGACEVLEWSGQKLWRIERGLTSMRTLDVKAMCEIYGADQQTTEALTALAKATKDRGWWHAYGDTVPAWFELYVSLEQAATGLRTYHPELVPGLLQTPEYARTIILVSNPRMTDGEVDRSVQLRLTRQHLLNRTLPPPPRLDVVLGEGAFDRMESNPDDMRDQLLYLLRMMRKPGISVSVLPRQTSLTPVANTGTFTILDFPRNGGRPSEPTTVYCQGLTGALYLDQDHEIERFEEIWAGIADDALSGDDAVGFIGARVEALA